MSNKLVLASTSPFRKAILEKFGVPFDTASPEVDETAQAGESAEQLVERLAEAKARAVAEQFPGALIIGSDQVAVIGDEILGKPGGHDKAIEQLRAASGKTVNFLTGLCLYNSRTDHAQCDVVPFKVHFRQLNDSQIENYLHREQPYNCAGSFKSEGLGVALFDRLEGDDPNTLIGLPLIRLIRMLEEEGFRII
ncbi:Maf family protein [Thiohalophilus thiocyanatoxydans]|uniref:7-methyl-GTP pyrophosphatase n=1 Tax=Thiohalophilus thiocyanatoxydans TaxID=381308 RepID=A0A4R8IU04_9GAMM|nr:nucleoside triphosphate pyrophosphatase [Thiohalophilus thiocyanatoxydans]TDY02910.1 MAF protein [Thiohalophilus thiocyanatoxydans]